jgi:hypothetical protein
MTSGFPRQVVFSRAICIPCACSDGDYPVEGVVYRYREKGYDFLAISDHFLEHYDCPRTDTRPFRLEDFTTLIAV